MTKTYGDYVREDYDTFGSPFDFTPAVRPDAATDKQISFLVKLATERGWTRNEGVVTTYIMTSPAGAEANFSELTKREASQLIDELLKRQKVATPKVTREPEITDGMYRNPLTGEIFKVQLAVHGSGKLYAKKLMVEGEGQDADVWFDYAPGAVCKLRPEWKMTLEEAKAFGALYGTCCVCARTLTKEESIDAGIGPICAGKF